MGTERRVVMVEAIRDNDPIGRLIERDAAEKDAKGFAENGEKAMKEGRYADALYEFSSAVDLLKTLNAPVPDSYRQSLNRAFEAVRGKAEETAKEYEKLGNEARDRGDFRAAAKYYNSGVEALRGFKSNLTDDLVDKRNEAEEKFRSRKPGIYTGV
jgi:hypothetical protein